MGDPVVIGKGRTVRVMGADGLLQFEVEPQVAYCYHRDFKRALSYPRAYPNSENHFRRACRFDGSFIAVEKFRFHENCKPHTLASYTFRQGHE